MKRYELITYHGVTETFNDGVRRHWKFEKMTTEELPPNARILTREQVDKALFESMDAKGITKLIELLKSVRGQAHHDPKSISLAVRVRLDACSSINIEGEK